MMKRSVHTAFLLLIVLLYLQLGYSQLPRDQVSAMIGVYEIFQNNNIASFLWQNVGKDSNPCSWKGVSCSPDNSSITHLSFNSLSLSTSEFLPLLCNFTSLQSLDVSNNELSSVPDEFFSGSCGATRGLKLLNFSKNGLKSSLPDFISFTMLEHLDLSFNSLTGRIDLQLDGLDSLRSLNLSHNLFTGSIPTNLGKMNLLERLQLSANIFTGEIPVNITRYRNLSLIDLSINNLSGSIPEELGDLTRLETLVLSINNLSGAVPVFLSRTTTLLRFAANQNEFSGRIPPGITLHLETLDLSFNKLVGSIPPDLLSGPKLLSVDLSSNGLDGLIPENISTRLFRLRLGSNSLNGLLPARSLGRLVELMYLEVENNNLSGPIPPELGMCRKLALLNLAQNGFLGLLPPALSNLSSLQGLHLQMNNLVGEIPVELTQLDRLLRLNLSRNSLNGSIPVSISNLKSLASLHLQGNNLSGPIPESIGRLTFLLELQLGMNHFSGEIPVMPWRLQIGLNLSHNLFAGPIPDHFARLSNLEVLDISYNRFSGEIPDILTSMPSLTHLVLTNNQLTGVIPKFNRFVDVETEGNNLVNAEGDAPKAPRSQLASGVIIAVATAAVAVCLLILIALFLMRRYNRINDEHQHREECEEEETPAPQVVHGELLTSNAIHRSNIDFRKAMEAVADKANVRLKTRFSTYYKAVMPSGASYFVKKINGTDKMFQLGRQDKFGEELEVLGKLCNSNVMIPLAYVLSANNAYVFYDLAVKGSLSENLHPATGRSTLDWASRYSIAIGVSQGLAFLHECASGAILLLDLSSKNIMLKSFNEPQIGDIELCKVIDPSKSIGSMSNVAGSVGYVPPEYAYTMRVTAAGNVYSFGVVLLELVTGKPAVVRGSELAKWVSINTNTGQQGSRLEQNLDVSISRTSAAVRSQMVAVLKVAIACVSPSPETRPNMKSVLRMLIIAGRC